MQLRQLTRPFAAVLIITMLLAGCGSTPEQDPRAYPEELKKPQAGGSGPSFSDPKQAAEQFCRTVVAGDTAKAVKFLGADSEDKKDIERITARWSTIPNFTCKGTVSEWPKSVDVYIENTNGFHYKASLRFMRRTDNKFTFASITP